MADYIKERENIIANGKAAEQEITNRIKRNEILKSVLNDVNESFRIQSDINAKILKEQVELATSNEGFMVQLEMNQKLNALLETRSILMNQLINVSESDRANVIALINDTVTNLDAMKLTQSELLEKLRQEILLRVQNKQISMETAEAITKGVEKQLEAIGKVNEDMRKHQESMEKQRRSWSYGWKTAMNEYVEDVTNGAKQAERVFRRFTQSMEDSIVDFAKTGKFNFRSFLNSILEDLLRSQVRQLIGQIFNAGGGGRTGSTIGRLLGFANGGIIPTNSPVLVGERGPEIISGAQGRVVTPNNQQGGTSVTYNINAVDAMSFKQMIAQDPSFLYAVTQQGARSVPQTRR